MSAGHGTERALPAAAIWLGAAWLLVVQAALWWIHYVPDTKALLGDEIRYWTVAGEILAGGDWHPDPLWPPLQGLFIAAIRAFGGGLWTVQLVQLAMLVGSALLLARIVERLSGSARTGMIAGWLLLAWPPLVAYALYLWPEILHLFLLMLAWWLIACVRPGYAMAAALGAVLGLALLAKNLLLPLVALMFAPLLLAEPARLPRRLTEPGWPTRQAWGRLGLALAVFAAVIAPALIKGHQLTGRWVISDSSTFNLWVGLNEKSRSSLVWPVDGPEWGRWMDAAPDHAGREAIYRARIREQLTEQGVAATLAAQLSRQYFRLFGMESYLVMQFPGQRDYGYTSTYAAVPGPLRHLLSASSALLHLALLAGAVIGARLLRPGRHTLAWLWLVFIAYQLALFLLLHVKSRFLVPMLPVFCAWSACAVHALRHRQDGRWAWPSSALGWLPVAALIGLLWLFALAGPALDGRGPFIAW